MSTADFNPIPSRDGFKTLTAALFLEEFVDETPWAHIDIAGTASVNSDDSWRAQGASGFGARLLAELAVNFTPPRA